MNKNRMILSVSGGVILIAALVAAYFNWSAYSAKVVALEGDDAEGTEGLASFRDRASSLTHKSVYPCAESAKKIDANTEVLADWCVEARKLASRGDMPVRVTTPAQFKADIAASAKRLVALPGAVAGALAKPDFAFGPFRPYIAEGQMPTEAELPELTRKWNDVERIVELLAQSGIAEIVDVAFKVDEEADAAKAQDAAKKDKKSKRSRNVKKAVEPEAVPPASFSYVFTFTTRPVGFAKALNALGTDDRFMVVDSFSIARKSDPIGEALGAGSKKSSASETRRGRRSAARRQLLEEEDETAGSKVVTDPVLDAPFTVVLNVTVYDFRTMEEESAGNAEMSEKGQKEEAK